MNMIRKTVFAAAAAAAVATAPVLTATRAEAICGSLCQLGVGAAAVGAGLAVGSNLANRAMHRPANVVYAQPQSCSIQNRQVVNQYGQVVAVQQVQVCY